MMRSLLAVCAVLVVGCSKQAPEQPDADDSLYDHGGEHRVGDGYDLWCGKDYVMVIDAENHPFCRDK